MGILGNDLMAMYYMQNIIPTDGLKFYAPLADQNTTSEEGYTINSTQSGTSFGNIANVPCMLSASCVLTLPTPFGATNCTMCIWGKVASNGELLYGHIPPDFALSYGCYADIKDGGNTLYAYNKYSTAFNVDDITKWHFYTIVKTNNGYAKIYVDAAGKNSISINNPDTRRLYMKLKNGSSAAWRVYNRVLSDQEILALSKEFTPTT